jgi:Trk K+ transport system NAD-binding subunit
MGTELPSSVITTRPPDGEMPSPTGGWSSALRDDWLGSTGLSSLRRRFRYRFDNVLSRGTWAVLVWLGVATLFTILVSTLLLSVFGVTFGGSQDESWLEDFWQSALRTLDPGTMAGDVGWGRRLLALLVTLFGLLIAGTLIGIIAAGVEHRIEVMQRGRSAVVESGHVVILGASARLSVIVEQLALAGRSRRRNVIVVLADREPTELSHEVRSGATELYGTRLVFRWGDPTSVSDLRIVALEDARSVIVVASDDARDPGGVVKSVLAVGAELGGFGLVPIVAEVSDPQTGESLLRACGGAIHPVAPAQSIARIAAYSLRGPGLMQVIEELLDFRGPGLHLRTLGDLVGTSFGDCVLRFAKARPIGLMTADGAVVLNPDRDTVLDTSHRLILIADDDAPPPPSIHTRALRSPSLIGLRERPTIEPQHAQHVLVVGWNLLARQLLERLESGAAPGSSVDVVYDPRLLDDEDLDVSSCERLAVKLTPSTSTTWQLGDDAETDRLTSIFLLGYRGGLSPGEADSRTLLNLMVIKRELDENGLAPRVVVELLDADNVDLATPTGPEDFVISDAIASRLMAQLADQPERRAVLLRLYEGDGPTINLVDPALIGATAEVEFDDIVEVAYSFGLLAIGWRLAHERGGGLTLNPHGRERVLLAPGDRIVVID